MASTLRLTGWECRWTRPFLAFLPVDIMQQWTVEHRVLKRVTVYKATQICFRGFPPCGDARLHTVGMDDVKRKKTEGTDMHSVTAKAVGISRDHAKVINYARIYGAGQNFAERLLKQFNPTMSETEARSKARKMFDMTKGKKFYYLTREYVHEFGDHPFTKWQAMELAKAHGKKVSEMFETSKWVGGTESAMFNRLEEIANSDRPTTPFLGICINYFCKYTK
ncbi:unnamed protein product [Acanthoscelides obtectus]|uniref:DNA-directed DNA polymerase n=1 Tax=Acanthoscelides obtectus TaxID=200917 RepID=A0A9P0LZW0_ACAOB|nr:unnamed protein product [Acanthoscelides obtectus]CAK1676302.1 DNA polymerase subunit gamma-1, mitochondrial [Acanthoscelides obtectus]